MFINIVNIAMRLAIEERQIGTTELRQKLTGVIQAIKEEGVAYVVETFGRPQVVLIDLKEYRRLRGSQPKSAETAATARAAFGMWRDRPELDGEWLARNRRRWYSEWRKEGAGDE